MQKKDTYKLYKIVNSVTGKVYIGYTKRSLAARLHSHYLTAKKGGEYKLSRSIRKHGIENFVIEEITQSEDKAMICELEDKHPNWGKPRSEETKQRMIDAWIKRREAMV